MGSILGCITPKVDADMSNWITPSPGGGFRRSGFADFDRVVKRIKFTPVKQAARKRPLGLLATRRVKRKVAAAAARRTALRLSARAAAGYIGGAAAIGIGGYMAYRGIRRLRSKIRYRRKLRRARYTVGTRVGHARTKEKLVSSADADHASYTLHEHSVTQIGPKTTDTSSRNHNVINLRGVRLILRGIHKANGFPGVLQMMLIRVKSQGSALTLADDFWKGHGHTSDIAFSGLTTASEYVDRAKNMSRMDVLWYKKLNLIPKDGGTIDAQARSGRNYFTIDTFIRINRQLRFESDAAADVQSNERLLFVHWYAAPHNNAGGVTPVTGRYYLSRRIYPIWREVPN